MRAFLYLREFVKKERTNHYLQSFLISERLSTDNLKKLQLEKLIELLKYLKRNSPFFSKYLKENDIKLDRDWKDNPDILIAKLPITDKLFIKKNSEGWLTLNKDSKLSNATTSGSTGMPFRILHSSASRDVKAACKFRLLAWHGVKKGEKQLYFGCTYSSQKSKLSSLKISLNNKYVLNKIVIDFTKIREENIAKEIERINIEKPLTVWGYPSAIFEIAKYSIRNKLPITNEKLKMVILSGESNSQYMKDIIKQAFSLEPDDEYNSNEGFIAGTCEFHKLHLNDDTLIAEILHEDGTVSEYGKGELLVTFLYSFDFPFIRYNTGDIVEISEGKCQCGRNLKVLSAVDGRRGEVIYNGEDKISNSTCNHYLTKSLYIDTINKYQIVQNDFTSVTIKLSVSDTNRDYNGLELLMKGLFDKLVVNFEYVDDIPRDKSGKYRDVINNIKQA